MFNENDDWLRPFLERVRSRPGMWLGNESVHTLATFIHGYTQGREDLGVAPYNAEEARILDDFAIWIANKLGSKRSLGWPGHVAMYDPSDDNIKSFFRLLDEFAAETGLDLCRGSSAWPPNVERSKSEQGGPQDV